MPDSNSNGKDYTTISVSVENWKAINDLKYNILGAKTQDDVLATLITHYRNCELVEVSSNANRNIQTDETQ